MTGSNDSASKKAMPQHKPDFLEYIIRFTFGSVIGFIFGLLGSSRMLHTPFHFPTIIDFFGIDRRELMFNIPLMDSLSLLNAVFSAVLFGLVFLFLGKRFWEKVLKR